VQRHTFLGSTLGCVPSLPLGTGQHILIVDTYVAALSLSWPRAARRAAASRGGACRAPPHFRCAAPLTRTLAGCVPPTVERFPFVRQSECVLVAAPTTPRFAPPTVSRARRGRALTLVSCTDSDPRGPAGTNWAADCRSARPAAGRWGGKGVGAAVPSSLATAAALHYTKELLSCRRTPPIAS
jgi:hypothetical protein